MTAATAISAATAKILCHRGLGLDLLDLEHEALLDPVDARPRRPAAAGRRSRGARQSSPSDEDEPLRRERLAHDAHLPDELAVSRSTTGARRTCTTLTTANAHETRERGRDRDHGGQRDLVRVAGGLEEEQRADDEADGAGEGERPVGRHEGSAAKNATASSISRSPAALTGSTCKPKSAEDQADRAEACPGRSGPGFQSSTTMPSAPSDMKSDDHVRVDQRVEDPLPERHVDVRDLRPAVCRTMPFGFVLRPSILFSSAGRVGAIDVDHVLLQRFRARRGSSALRTAASAQPTLRPCSRASSRSEAAASLIDLAAQVPADVLPPTSIGVDEPMFVCGAIARMSAACADPDAGRGSARSVGRDVDDHRHLRRELGLVDLLHRRAEAAGRVEQDHDRVVALVVRAVDLAVDVVLRDRVDVVRRTRPRARAAWTRRAAAAEQSTKDAAERDKKYPQKRPFHL